MAHQDSYYLYERWDKIDGQEYLPSYPPLYSIDGNGTKERVLKQQNDPNCPEIDSYRWYAPSSSDYVCVGESKHYKEYYQVSYDDGQTWSNVVPTTIRAGEVISQQSSDCTSSYENMPLTLVADEGLVFWLESIESPFRTTNGVIGYSIDDGETWEYLYPITTGHSVTNSSVYIPKGAKVQLKDIYSFYIGDYRIRASNYFHLEGNMSSLIDNPNRYYFKNLFSLNEFLTSAENLVLPARGIYNGLFSGCTSLTVTPQISQIIPVDDTNSVDLSGMFARCSSLEYVPNLPQADLYKLKCKEMFAFCTSLKTVPSNYLSGTTLSSNCYNGMFEGCSGLTNAPILPAETLQYYCYYLMFSGCTSLSAITCLATDISASFCTSGWLKDVAPVGVFTKNSAMNSWTRGIDGIPSGWTINNNTIQHRTASGTPYCIEYDKYVDVYSQVSYDSGSTWITTATTPTLVEAQSTDCGYVFNGKWLARYSGGTTSSAECDSTYNIYEGEITLTDLVSVEIGDCITSINNWAFGYCSSLTSIDIPDSVTSIGNNVFASCTGLTSCTIPSGVTYIGRECFYSCSSLQSVTVLATTPPTLGNSVFYNTNNCPIYVPSSSVNAYKSASGWSIYASRILAIP